MAEIKEILAEMVKVAEKELGKKWPKYARLGVVEFGKIAESIALINEMLAAGELTEDEAIDHYEIQYNAVSEWISAFAGMGIIEAEGVLNRILKVIFKFIPNLPAWIIWSEE